MLVLGSEAEFARFSTTHGVDIEDLGGDRVDDGALFDDFDLFGYGGSGLVLSLALSGCSGLLGLFGRGSSGLYGLVGSWLLRGIYLLEAISAW